MPAAGSIPAGLGRRLLARVIDAVTALVLGGGLLVGGLVGQLRAGDGPTSAVTVAGAALLVGQALVQWWLLATRGYTFGRLVSGVRVLTTEQGRPIGAGRALARELVAGTLLAVPVLGPVVLTLSARADPTGRLRGWQDLVGADTVFDVNVGVDPAVATPTPAQATERLQALLGEQDRRRHRDLQRVVPDGPPVPVDRLPVPVGGPRSTSNDEGTEMPRNEPTRVVPDAPYEQVASASYRALDDDVERTRLREARTKVAYAPTRAQTRPRATLLLWDNRVVVLEGTALVGRNPSPREGEALPVQVIAVLDRGRSVSKTHLAIGVDPDGVWLKDRNSTNGTVVTLEDGQQILCAPEQKVRVPVGASVAFGDYWLTIAG